MRRRQRQERERKKVIDNVRSSESPATAAAVLMFTLKGKHKKNCNQQSPIVACSLLRWTNGSNALLYEPMVSFNAMLYCLAADEIAAFC